MEIVVDHISYVWGELRILREYTKPQLDTFSKLRDVYMSSFGYSDSELSQTVFAVNSDTGFPLLSKELCDSKLKQLVCREFSDNPLTPFVNDILVTIQEYYRLRCTGIRRMHSYINDPRSLLCIHILEFARSLLKSDRSNDLHELISKWIAFFTQVRINNVFSVYETSQSTSDTLYSVLVNIEKKLRGMVIFIQMEIRERSIGEHLDSLISIGRNIIDFYFLYAATALCNKTTPYISVGSFHNAIVATNMKYWMKDNYVANLLQQLAMKKSIIKFLGILEGELTFNEQFCFLTNETLPEHEDINSLLTCRSTAQFFKQNVKIGSHFLSSVINISALSELLLICKEAAFLTKMVGEVLLCWNEITNQLLYNLMAAVRSVLQTLGSDMACISHQLRETHLNLTSKLGKIEDEDNWKSNYRRVSQIEKTLVECDKLTKMDTICLSIQQTLESPESRIEETQDRLSAFVNGIQSLFSRVRWLPKCEEILLLTQQLKSPKRLELRRSALQNSDVPVKVNQIRPRNFSTLQHPLSKWFNNADEIDFFTVVGDYIALPRFYNKCSEIILIPQSAGNSPLKIISGNRKLQILTWISESHLCSCDDLETSVWTIPHCVLVFKSSGVANINLNHQLYIYLMQNGTRTPANLFDPLAGKVSECGPAFLWNFKTVTTATLYDHSPSSDYIITGGLKSTENHGENVVDWQQIFDVWEMSTHSYQPKHIIAPECEGDRVIHARFLSDDLFYLQWVRRIDFFERNTGNKWYSVQTTFTIFRVFLLKGIVIVLESPNSVPNKQSTRLPRILLIDVAKREEGYVEHSHEYFAAECTIDAKIILLTKIGFHYIAI